MKKSKWTISRTMALLAACVMTFGMAFTACGDDEDETESTKEPSASKTTTTIEEEGDERAGQAYWEEVEEGDERAGQAYWEEVEEGDLGWS